MPYQQLESPGNYRGYPEQWGVKKTTGGAVEFTGLVRLEEEYFEEANGEPAGWYQIANGIREAWFHICIIKKDGSPNQSGIDQMKAAFGWDGNWESLVQGGEQGVDFGDRKIQVRADHDSYNGKASIKVKWVNGPDDPVGTSINALAMDEVSKLAQHFGSTTRALCGGTVPVPQGRPKAPARQPAPAPVARMAAPSGDDIPFNGAGA